MPVEPIGRREPRAISLTPSLEVEAWIVEQAKLTGRSKAGLLNWLCLEKMKRDKEQENGK